MSHGHFAFWGAYGCGVIAMMYLILQQTRNAAERFDSRAWKWRFGLLNLGLVGMVGGLLVAGITQAIYERAQGGSTLQAFVVASENHWFRSAMYARLFFGVVFALGYLILVYDLLAIGKRATVAAPAQVASA